MTSAVLNNAIDPIDQNDLGREDVKSNYKLPKKIQTKNISYKGLSIRYAIKRSKSANRPFLLLNGIGQSIEVIAPIIEAFDDRDVIAIDVPGTGLSQSPSFPWRMKSHAQLIAHILDAENYEKVDVLGFSWGGTLAKYLCRYFPDHVNKLILAAAPPGNLMIPGGLGVYLRMMNPKRFQQKDFMRSIAPAIYGGDVRHSLHVVDENAKRLIPPAPTGYLFQGISMWGTAPLLWLKRLKQPTLILQGIDDPMIPNMNALIVNRLLPDSEIHFVDCGHMFMLTRLEEVQPMIVAFLEGER